jgi:DNA-binding GntR family transcriptional regulator
MRMSQVSGVAELVRLVVLQGEVRPGERLVEARLAERFRGSRAVVREALRRLEGEGLLVADESGGMHVIGLGEQELRETLEVRAALEALAAGLAAQRVRDGQATGADLRELEALAGAGPGLEADRHFHRAVAALSGNGPCRHALDHVWDRLVIADRPASTNGGHGELVGAIANGDPGEAAAQARRHVLG